MLKHIKTYFTLCFILQLAGISFGQQELYIRTQSITHKDGLSDNFCETLLIDSYGFLWVGTNDGLCKYDGHRFYTYKYNQFDAHSIGNSFIFSLFEDSDNVLWIGTNMGGLAKYNRNLDNFTRIVFEANDTVWQERNRINQIIEIHDHLYIASMYGLGKLDRQNLQSEWFIPKSGDNINIGQIMAIKKDNLDNIWICTLHDGVYYFDTKKELFTKHLQKEENNANSIIDNSIIALHIAQNNEIWFGSKSQGISVYNPQTNLFKNYTNSTTNNNSIGSKDFSCFFENNNGELWVCTINGNIYQYNRNKDSFIKATTVQNNNTELSLTIRQIVQDKQNNYYMATHGNGINIINNKTNRFGSYYNPNNKHISPQNNFISCFYEMNDSCIYIGTDGDGLVSFNTTNNKTTTVNIDGLERKSILDIEASANPTELWIATWGDGIFLINTKNNTIEKRFSTDSEYYIPHNDIKSIFFQNDTLWISTHEKGIFLLNTTTNSLIPPSTTDSIFNYLDIPQHGTDILIDSKQRKWFGTISGLYVYNRGKFKSYYKTQSLDFSLNGFIIADIYEDSNQRIWVCTENGLNLYNEESERFIPIDHKYGIPSKIKSIQEAEESVFWISSNSGLTRFDYNTKKTIHFTEKDGLQSNLFIDRSSHKLHDKKLIFGGQNGFNIFNPTEILQTSEDLQVYISSISILNIEQKPGNKGSVLDKHIFITDNISVPYAQNIISIEYSALNFEDPHKTRYAYHLTGFDKNWHYAEKNQKAIYTNLEPGTYNFEVKASTSKESLENNKIIRKLTITITPPWWKTIIFKFIASILGILLFISIYSYRIRSINRINKELEQKVKKRTIELESSRNQILEQKQLLEQQANQLSDKNLELVKLNNTKDKFFSILAHDLKNPIQIILGFTELLYNKKDNLDVSKRNKFTYLAFETAQHVSDLLTNILDWSRTQTNNIKFRPLPHDICKIIDSNISMFNIIAGYKNIEIISSCSVSHNIMLDIDMINTILRNLITNAIKFTNEDGSINIVVSETANSIEISVIDDGIGMSKSKLDALFESTSTISSPGTNMESGTGLGLSLCKDFIERHRGTLNIQSEEGVGSTFTFTIPK